MSFSLSSEVADMLNDCYIADGLTFVLLLLCVCSLIICVLVICIVLHVLIVGLIICVC